MIISVEKLYSNNKWTNTYRLVYSDNSVWDIPHSEDNRHYKEIQEYIKNGGEVIDNPPSE